MPQVFLMDNIASYLFPAYGGTGKTTLSLGLMREDLHFLGDDLLIVDASTGLVGPYLRPLHVFTYNIKTLRDASIPLSLKARVKAKDILRIILEKTTKQEFLISTRVHASDLYDNLKKVAPAPYKKINFLKKIGEDETIAVTSKTKRDLALRILESEDLNDSLYENILEKDEKSAVVKKRNRSNHTRD